jgi:signal peptidase II
MIAMHKKHFAFLATFLVSVAGDQLSKMWARAALKPTYRIITVIPEFFEFRYSENTGSAFGLFRGMAGARYLLFAVGVIALVVVISFLRKTRPDALRVPAELGLLAGGAIGNIIDRVYFGKVTDFILWKVHTHEWPIFNVADAALVVGVLALLFDMKAEEKSDKTQHSGAGQAEGEAAKAGSRKRRRD